jgi:hypothetical protein
MIGAHAWRVATILAAAALALGVAGCIIGALHNAGAFYPAWLVVCLFWLGLPLGAVTLVLVHDLTGGRWMASARLVLEAAIVTMPLASLAFLPLIFDLGALYRWSAPPQGLGNAFYLNEGFFILRYAVDVVIWNGLALWALLAPRGLAIGAPPALSWVSGIGLVLLAYSAAFASIDWIMSLEPAFWSAVMPMFVSAGWFNTGLALVLLVLALSGALSSPGREHRADLAALLLATVIFWAYTEFCQFLIIWEENLTREIQWYVTRLAGGWEAVMYAVAAIGFFIPFFTLLWRPSKRSRAVVAVIGGMVLLSRLLESCWWVLPEFPGRSTAWRVIAGLLALSGLILLLFLYRLRQGRVLPARHPTALEASHGRA